jgi:hypothetical protein
MTHLSLNFFLIPDFLCMKAALNSKQNHQDHPTVTIETPSVDLELERRDDLTCKERSGICMNFCHYMLRLPSRNGCGTLEYCCFPILV